MSLKSTIRSPLFYPKKAQNVIIRDIKEGDGKDIVNIFEENYFDTYYKKSFYNPKTWDDMVKSEKYYPVVAEINSRVVGEFLMSKNDEFNAEISAVVVHPEFKGMGLMNRMFDFLIQKAKSLKLKAIYGEAIMFHPFSQKANLKHGMVESAYQLGEVASWIAQKDVKFSKRSGTLVAYLVFDKRRRFVNPPKQYKNIILQRYKKLKIKTLPKYMHIKSALYLNENPLLKVASIIIDAKPKNFKNSFFSLFSKAKIKNDMIYADINLHTSNVQEITDFLNRLGFFYSGVLFYRHNGFDYLRLQYENTHNVEEKLNVCYSKHCKFLKRFVFLDKIRIFIK